MMPALKEEKKAFTSVQLDMLTTEKLYYKLLYFIYSLNRIPRV